MPSRTWRETVPTIVAESLRLTRSAPAFLPRDRGAPGDVAAALARAALPLQSSDPPPAWLLPHQGRSHARLLAALRRFGGALLAEPVGSGKTYTALAAASTLSGRATCIVPAALVTQWRATAARLGVPAEVSSHERASRGTLPRARGLVLVDESHHYRNPDTRRYRHLARWLVGHRALLLSATPVVNRLSDLSAQLALILPDDALAPLGVPSIAELRSQQALPAAVALIVQTDAPGAARPEARGSTISIEGDGDGLTAGLATLALSRRRPVAALLRGLLLRAAASSPAALDACLRRYRLLLLQARDAAEAGVRPDRASLRRWAGELPEQTVLWQLLDDDADAELDPGDLPRLDALIRLADAAAERPDAKAARLADLVADGTRTLVFTASRDTALWLRRWIEPAAAWCTGEAAGVGHTRMPRASVLQYFAPDNEVRRSARLPHVLLATDVAAEGLDLQGAQRVVHYDLPWTPARLGQREGRARRLGARHRVVEVVTFDPPPAIERELRQLRILDTKRRLTARARLAGADLDRLRHVLESAAAPGMDPAAIGTLEARGEGGALIGLTLVELSSRESSWGTTLCWLPRGGGVERDAGIIASRLVTAHGAARPADPPDPTELDWLAEAIGGPAAEMLRAANASRLPAGSSALARRLLRRLHSIGRVAARNRDDLLLAALDRAVRAAARGHSAGEALLVRELVAAPDRELLRRLTALPDRAVRAFDVRVAGVVLFRPAGVRLP